MQQFKRVAAMLLCLVMLFSCLPVGAIAADTDKPVDAAVIFSDLHTSQYNYKESTLTGVMTALKNAELPVSSVTSAGDAFSVNESYSMTNGEYTGYTGTLTGYIQNVLGDVPVNYVWTDHDRCAVQADNSTLLDKTSRLVYGAGADGIYGTADDGNYYVYVLSMADTGSWDRYSAGFYTASEITAHVAAFKTAAVALDKSKPLFIVAHQPLLDNRGDNGYAYQWALAINEVAADMDVAYFFGHNHKYDVASDYYCAKGQTMSVATTEVLSGSGYSTDLKAVDVELNFTHMCAGYMSPGTTSDTTRQGVAVGIAIYDDEITYTTYNANGVYTGNYALNETVKRAHAKTEAPEATEPETTAPAVVEKKDETTGVTVSAPGITGVTVGVKNVAVPTGYSAYATFDITLDGYTDGSEATVTIPTPAGFDASKPAVVLDQGQQIAVDNDLSDGITFTTSHFSEYDVAQVEETAGSTIKWKEIPGKTTYKYVQATSITKNSKYVIVGNNHAIALMDNSGSMGAQSVTINGTALTSDTALTEWTFSGTNSGTVKNGTRYLRYNNGFSLSTSSHTLTFTDNGSNFRIWNNASWGTDYSFYYDGSSWTRSDSTQYVRLYTNNGTTTTDTVYVGFSGQTSYMLDKGAYADAEAVLDMVRDNIHVYTATSASGAGQQEIIDYTLTGTVRPAAPGQYTLTVSYNNTTLETITVKVAGNDYPEYPNEGSVKVNKTGTGVQFQSTGVAQVEISASGIPMKKGADVIVMVDTSSSMDRHIDCGEKSCSGTNCDKVTRASELQKALEDLVEVFQTPGDNGEFADLRVAFADFNGFFGGGSSGKFEGSTISGTPYDLDSSDYTDARFNANADVHVIAGSTLDYNAFMDVQNLPTSFAEFNTASGTNYDYAFDVIYQLGTAAKQHNKENGEDRDLYVIFMSDGAPNQFNYYSAVGGTNGSQLWDYWLTGGWNASNLNSNLNCTTHAYYYDLNDHDGDGAINEHRMANAIKGDPDKQYEVVRKSTAGLPEGTLTSAGKTNLYTVPGLGAKMYAIAFAPANDGPIDKASMLHALKQIASDQEDTTSYYYEIEAAEGLSGVFTSIGSEIAYAAYNARFVDQMGEDYDLQMGTIKDLNGDAVAGVENKIEILSYDIYTRQDYLNGTIPLNKVGDRKGTYKVLETVTFSADGKQAYSDKKSGNILVDGVICAQSFWYNTTADAVPVDGVAIPTSGGTTNMLPAETFYWKMGTVRTSELAMRYYVYLTGTMEGTREAGSYPTNEYATLYYDNYLHNPCYKDTISPVLAWEAANVSYAFYLVDENGNIIVNQTTGEIGSFANKIAVTNPVVYKEVLLNNSGNVESIEVASLGVLPEGYELYDESAVYTIQIKSDATGSWTIQQGKTPASTYVTQYDPENPAAYSNETGKNSGADFTHTVVWFAVLWKVQALPDTVVIDYGLPVDISVLTNDMFGENGKLAAVGAYDEDLEQVTGGKTLATGFGTTYSGTYGDAKIDAATGKVRYTLHQTNGMQMNSFEKFTYAANYTGSTNPGYYYDTVTVIPATTIYYEDDFVTYSYTGTGTGWEKADPNNSGSVVTQAEDRPGKYSLSYVDANNVYGYDGAYSESSQFSLGNAMKVSVDAGSYATAAFSYWGTGFDVISLTSNRSGVLLTRVYAYDAYQDYLAGTADKPATVSTGAVNTYYGYDYIDGKWKVTTSDDDNALYQIPVMQAENLSYGHYTVEISAEYFAALDKTGNSGYDLYLDAIRIYDPAGVVTGGVVNETISNAYKADGEGWPKYIEVRNHIIGTEGVSVDAYGNLSFAGNTTLSGAIFIDGQDENLSMADYVSYGPNNELYLAAGQSIAFKLDLPTKVDADGDGEADDNIVADVQIGLKLATGDSVTYKVYNANITTVDAATAKTLNTATDMYYSIRDIANGTIVITNASAESSDAVLSVTHVKVTYVQDPETIGQVDDSLMTTSLFMDEAGANMALMSLRRVAVEPDVPETTVPEETEPETTIPEETEPTIPEETEPETTVPEETEPDNGIIDIGVGKVIRIIKKIIGMIIG